MMRIRLCLRQVQIPARYAHSSRNSIKAGASWPTDSQMADMDTPSDYSR